MLEKISEIRNNQTENFEFVHKTKMHRTTFLFNFNFINQVNSSHDKTHMSSPIKSIC